ncbi:restriction endonuclease subunit S [Vibrio cholerae]|nr:restriction endonuclease subunit S [Vibrio cholerae]
MAGRYKAYPEYKDSGVEWVGKIPSHWGLKKLKYLAPLISEKAKGKTNPIALEHIQSWTGKLISTDSKFDGDGTKFKAGDILFGKLRPYLAKVYLTEEDGEAIGDFHVMRPINSSYGKFLKSLMLTTDYISTVDASTYGAKMPRASWDFTSNIQLPFCSETEAEKIANFLDHETAKIDALIAKQEKLIELLKEKRQAVISHAVTKGLNPDAPMKNSGVEWLGEVPEHWSLCSIKYLCREITDGAHISPDLKEGVHHFVSIKDIKNGEINFDDSLLTSEESYHYLVKTGCMPFEGDILFSKDGTIGQTAITPPNKDFVVASSLIIIRPNLEKVSSEYLDLMLQSSLVKEQVESFVKGAALRRLSIQNLLKVFGLRPPLNEQKKIAEHVNLQLSKFSALEDKAQKQVQLLQERKTALISAAVTGKIDVRHFVTEQGQPQGAQG